MIAVHVAQLLQAPVGTTRSYEFSEAEPWLEDELGVRGPITGRVKLTRTTHGILAECSYRAELEQECGRCLSPARCVVESEFSSEFLPSIDVFTGLPQEIVADPEEPRIGPNHLLDLADEIRQDIVTSQPIQPLCREACAGLCPNCGQDLNVARCDCERHEDAEPVGRLGELLKSKLTQA